MQSKSKMYELITLYKLTSLCKTNVHMTCQQHTFVHLCRSHIHQGFGEGSHRSFATPTVILLY